MKTVSSQEIRRLVLELARDCGAPVHLGGSLSQVDILNCLYGQVLRHDPNNPDWSGRDIFLLSKGHAFLSLLATLHLYGYFSRSVLNTFQSEESGFISHPVRDIQKGIEGTTGSLGHGLSYGMGVAYAMKRRRQDRKVFVLMGDSESSEGSIWEGVMLAPRLQLSNLVAIVDCNGFGNDVSGVVPSAFTLAGLYRAAGWSVEVVDGHDSRALLKAFEQPQSDSGQPLAIIAETIKGRGIAMMEGNNDWHHNRVSARTFDQAVVGLVG